MPEPTRTPRRSKLRPARAALLVTAWGRDPSSAWRTVVRQGIGLGVRWCFCANGPALRVIDSQRTYSRRFVEFDLQAAIENPHSFEIVGTASRRGDVAARGSARHRAGNRGLRSSPDRRPRFPAGRCSRGAVATGGRIHHDDVPSKADVERRRRPRSACRVRRVADRRLSDPVPALRRGARAGADMASRSTATATPSRRCAAPVERLPRPRGLWEALQAIARLAHRGCRAGSLRVPPFNGRLFSPAHAPLADSLPLDDGAVRRGAAGADDAGRRAAGRQRIAYADLGVEQLGGVYERVLDFELVDAEGDGRALHSFARSAARPPASFYTPRTLTESSCAGRSRRSCATRRRNAILVAARPRSGDGQRRVSGRGVPLSRARVRDGADSRRRLSPPTSPTPTAPASGGSSRSAACTASISTRWPCSSRGCRCGWRRLAARPAADVSRSSLRAGNSLVGASLADIARRPPAASRAEAPRAPAAASTTSHRRGDRHAVVDVGYALAQRAGRHARTGAREGTRCWRAARHRSAARALEAGRRPLVRRWFRDGRPAGSFDAFADALLDEVAVAAAQRIAAPILAEAQDDQPDAKRFFHWALEFPEVFYARRRPLAAPASMPSSATRPGRCCAAIAATARGERLAGRRCAALDAFRSRQRRLPAPGDGHANLYQLFVERRSRCVRRGRPHRPGPAVGLCHRSRLRRTAAAPPRSHRSRQLRLGREPGRRSSRSIAA